MWVIAKNTNPIQKHDLKIESFLIGFSKNKPQMQLVEEL